MKMKKKLLSILLALCLAMTLVPMSAFAEETAADSWDGTADTSWYTSAPDASAYHISTAEQLAGLAQLVNADPGTTNFAGKTFYLENDLDLSGHEWISIGTCLGGDYPEYSFCGVFDGQCHVIANLYSHESYIEGADESHNLLRNALFGSVYNGEVKNLGVANAEIWIDPKDDSAAGKGILVDWMGKSKITNCWTSGSIYSGTKIEKNIGGIVGVTMQGCTISGCYSTATLTGNFTNSEGYYTEPDPANWPFDTIGGIVGARFDGNLTVTDCWFDGKIVVNSITAAVGGIVGYTDDQLGSGTVNNCMVTTTDMGVDNDGNTCWVAYALGGTVENCYWPNDTKYGPSPLAYGEGTAVTDFTSADVLDGLKTNASAGIEWVAGISHPTFVWDDNNISADYTAVDAAIASAEALDFSLYKNYSAVGDSINAVDRVKSKAQQTEVDAMAKAIEDAIKALVYKDADYTKVDEAIAKVNALKKDNYQDFSGVEAAVNAVVRDKNITKQSEVDAMAKAIEDAITALVYKDADYTKVDEAIAKVNALKKDNYRDFSGVEAAVNAVKRDKNVTEQSEVDAMAKAIEDAIKALVYKDADYTKVNEAIKKANALEKDNYKDFSGVEAAVKDVVRGKNITEQSEVDKMAKAIEKAIDALEYKGADYTKVDAAIGKANALNKKDYKDFSGVEAAVNAVVRDKNITEQSEVDKMAKAIEKAIDALQYKGADYTKVDAAIDKVNALNKKDYKDFSGVEAAVKAVVRGKNITEQSEVDKMAKAIEKAIDALQYKGADYTKVDEAIAKAKALNKDNYKDFSGVEAAVNAVVRDKNITEQSEVDKMAKAIEKAIDALQYKGADYTKVDEAIAKAKALNKDNYKDFSGVEAAVNAVVRDKNITEQSEVDKMAKAIEKAIDALQYKGADYTKVDEAIAKAKALNKDNYKDFSGVEAAVNAVVRDKNITEQSEVDKMAKAIEKAIDALEYKGANYTKVDAAIAKAKALNKDNYKDFSGVEVAVKAVVRGKNITEQSEVDKMAKAIEKAIDALQYKGADYTKVDAAIAKAKALNKDNYKDFSGVDDAVKAVVRGNDITKQTEVDAMAKAIDDAISVLQYKNADYTKVDAVIAKAPEPSIASGNNNNTNTNGGRVTGTSDSSKNTDSRNNSDTEIKPYIKDDSGKEGWDVINSQLDEAKSGETVTVVMNGTTVVPKDIFDSIKGEDVTLVLDMGDGISWKINGKDITDAAGDIDFGVTVGADAGKSIPVDVINNVTGERYSMNLSLAYDGEFGFTAKLTINMESKNSGLYANLFYYNEQTGKLEFVSAGLIDAAGNVELEFTHASDYTVVIDAAVMDGGNKDSINTTKDNANAEDNTTIPASNADNAKSDAWNPAIIIIIGICILLIVFGAVIFVRKKSGSEEE